MTAPARHPVLRVLGDYAWPHRWSYLAGFACLWATNQLTVEIPIQIGAAIDALGAGAPEGARAPALWIAAMGATVILVRTLSRVLIFNPGRDVEYELRKDLFDKLMRLRPDFYAGRTQFRMHRGVGAAWNFTMGPAYIYEGPSSIDEITVHFPVPF